MEQSNLSKSLKISFLYSNCPQRDVYREVWRMAPGTEVRIYVGLVRPKLPSPKLTKVPPYSELWLKGLGIEIIAEDERTKSYWDSFRLLSLDHNSWSSK
jgi:hypothetical protein